MKSAIMFLRYSQTTDIHLYGHGGFLRPNRFARRLAHELKKQLQAASGRIVSFHIIEPSSAMLRLWPTRAPILEEMVISTSTSFPLVFRGEMPLLRSITTPVINHHQVPMAQHLTSLTLYPPYTLETLLATLKTTPLLRRLELCRMFELAHNDLPRVPLPHLELLWLSDCHYQIIHFIDFPAHTCITVSVPGHLEGGVTWRDIDIISAFYIPPAFLRSSTLTIITKEVRRLSAVRFVAQTTGGRLHCLIHIDLELGSSLKHRRGVCVYAMGMVRNMTSVSSLHLDARVPFPSRCTAIFKRFRSLRVLTLSGPFTYPTLLHLASATIDLVPSLERLVLDQEFMPLYRKFKDWLVSREQALLRDSNTGRG